MGCYNVNRFALSVTCEVVPLLWTGYGHITLDCVVATYYAQAEVQLKILKFNLEHLFDTEDVNANKSGSKYRDVTDPGLIPRFVYYVQRYEKLAW